MTDANRHLKELEELAALYRNPHYRVLENILKKEIENGFNKMLRKRCEEKRGELASELRAYKTVIERVEGAYNQINNIK